LDKHFHRFLNAASKKKVEKKKKKRLCTTHEFYFILKRRRELLPHFLFIFSMVGVAGWLNP
jgi:hypothetical protein